MTAVRVRASPNGSRNGEQWPPTHGLAYVFFRGEGQRRFPFPEEVVANNRERPDYLARFNIEKF